MQLHGKKTRKYRTDVVARCALFLRPLFPFSVKPYISSSLGEFFISCYFYLFCPLFFLRSPLYPHSPIDTFYDSTQFMSARVVSRFNRSCSSNDLNKQRCFVFVFRVVHNTRRSIFWLKKSTILEDAVVDRVLLSFAMFCCVRVEIQ